MASLSKAKLIFPALILLAPAQLAFAQSAPSLSDLFACESISNTYDQLTCFRSETAKLRGRHVEPKRISLQKEAPVRTVTPVQPDRIIAPTASEAPAIQKETIVRQDIQNESPAATDNADDPERFIPLAKKIQQEAPKKRALTIDRVETYGRNDYYRFFLKNGEVWQQADRGLLRVGKGEGPDILNLTKGAFGSYQGRINGKSPSVRVKRVR